MRKIYRYEIYECDVGYMQIIKYMLCAFEKRIQNMSGSEGTVDRRIKIGYSYTWECTTCK